MLQNNERVNILAENTHFFLGSFGQLLFLPGFWWRFWRGHRRGTAIEAKLQTF